MMPRNPFILAICMQGMQHSALWDDDVYDYVDDTRTSGVDVLGKKYDR